MPNQPAPQSITVCAVQVERQVDLRHTVHRAGGILLDASVESPDFALIGGEYSLNESRFHDPYPPISDLAQSFQSTVIAPVDALLRRFGEAAADHAYESMHVFDTRGEIVAIQDKHFCYADQRLLQMPRPHGHRQAPVRVHEVDGVRLGLVRGLDLLHPSYTQRLSEAEVLFVSALAIDDIIFDAACARAYENQCYVVLASFVGSLLGQPMHGLGAIIAPEFPHPGMPAPSRVIQRLNGPGLMEAVLDLGYIRDLKAECPFDDYALADC